MDNRTDLEIINDLSVDINEFFAEKVNELPRGKIKCFPASVLRVLYMWSRMLGMSHETIVSNTLNNYEIFNDLDESNEGV